jgi:hypothetical protein
VNSLLRFKSRGRFKRRSSLLPKNLTKFLTLNPFLKEKKVLSQLQQRVKRRRLLILNNFKPRLMNSTKKSKRKMRFLRMGGSWLTSLLHMLKLNFWKQP